MIKKRILVCSGMGMAFGILFFILSHVALRGGQLMSAPVFLSIVLPNLAVGFFIGISVLPLPWWLHGVAVGAAFSFFKEISLVHLAHPAHLLTYQALAIPLLLAVLCGLLVELMAVKVFNAPKPELR